MSEPQSVLPTWLNSRLGGKVNYRRKGNEARGRGDWEEAARLYRLHLKRRPADFDIWVQLGHAEKEAGRMDAADEAYTKADTLRPNDADLLLNRGHLARRVGDDTAAVRFYRASLSVQPLGAARVELENLGASSASEMVLQPSLVGGGTRGAIDSVASGLVIGWAWSGSSSVPAEVEVLRNGELIGQGAATILRPDVEAAGLGRGVTGFELALPEITTGDVVAVRIKGSGEPLANSPITVEAPAHVQRWLARNASMDKASRQAMQERCTRETSGRLLSIVMPVYNTPSSWLECAIDSVLDQWCENWELICVDDASANVAVSDTLQRYSRMDPRVRMIRMPENSGIAKATNAGIEAARGDYIALMDHDDMLEPECVYRILSVAGPDVDLIYTDEATTGDSIDDILSFVTRPAFSHDYYLSHPYFVHMVCVRAELAKDVGGFDESMKISADVDFVLRVVERSRSVAHIPAVLYRWRTHGSSAGHASISNVSTATVGSINQHLSRLGVDAVASPSDHHNTFRVEYADAGGKVLVIIPTRDRVDLLKVCLESLWATVNPDDVDVVVIDHESREPATARYLRSLSDRISVYPYSGAFNFSRMNNAAFRKFYRGQEFVLFLNNDIEATKPGWLTRMRSLAARPEVGAVGATLLYGHGTVQHCGVLIGIGGSADHGHKFARFKNGNDRALGFNCSLVSTRDYSAVTAACLMMPSPVFEGVGGFDEELEVGFNDTDLCLRVSKLGYAVLNDADSVLYHHESATRVKSGLIDHPADGARFVARWGELLWKGDPFYSPLLSKVRDHHYGDLNVMTHPARIRPVKPLLRALNEGVATHAAEPLRYHFVDRSAEVSAALEAEA